MILEPAGESGQPPERFQTSGPGWPREEPPGPVTLDGAGREWALDTDQRWWIRAGDLWYPSYPETMTEN